MSVTLTDGCRTLLTKDLISCRMMLNYGEAVHENLAALQGNLGPGPGKHGFDSVSIVEGVMCLLCRPSADMVLSCSNNSCVFS